MNSSRTYVFVFVPIPEDWKAKSYRDSDSTRCRNNGSGNNGSVPLPIQSERMRGAKVPIMRTPSPARETDVLSHHLFWTWFVDNPRRSCS
jgi:hypothetical protein